MGVISTRILAQAYNQIGIKIKAMALPPQRSLVMANNGDVDGELFRGVVNKNDFPNLIMIPVVLAYGQIVVFTKDLEFKVAGWGSLSPYTIGTMIGLKEIEVKTAGMKVEAVATPYQLFRKLSVGRNEIIVLPKWHGLKIMKDMDIKDIKILEAPLQQNALYHYLHNKHESLVPKITAVLKQMEEGGEIQRISEQTKAEFFQ